MMEQLEECRRKLEQESVAHAETKESLKAAVDRLDAKLMEAKVKSLPFHIHIIHMYTLHITYI
jgi:hypothetical protein